MSKTEKEVVEIAQIDTRLVTIARTEERWAEHVVKPENVGTDRDPLYRISVVRERLLAQREAKVAEIGIAKVEPADSFNN